MDVKLAFGTGSAGELESVQDVERGLACNCTCPACGEKLVARKGKRMRHHFAHYRTEQCSSATETALHLYAKQVLAQEKAVWIPALTVTHEMQEHKIREGAVLEFESVETEVKIGDVRPDLLVVAKGKQLAIEICVTHKVDDVKRKKLFDQKLSTLEIVLPLALASEDKTTVCEAVVSSAPRRWVYSEAAELFQKDLIAKSKANRQAEEGVVRGFLELYRAADPEPSITHEASARAIVDTHGFIVSGLSLRIGVSIHGWRCFRYRPLVWQAAIVSVLLERLKREDSGVSAAEIFRELKQRHLVRPEFSYVPRKIERAARNVDPEFFGAYSSCSLYLELLTSISLLYEQNFSYSLHWNARENIERKERYDQNHTLPLTTNNPKKKIRNFDLVDEAISETGAELEVRVRKILCNVFDERYAALFSFDRWFCRKDCFEGRSVSEVLKSPEMTRRFNSVLSDLEVLSQGWASHQVENLLCLPLETLNERLPMG